MATDAQQVAEQLIKFVFEPEMAEQMNARAQEIMQKNTGSLKKHIQVINQYL